MGLSTDASITDALSLLPLPGVADMSQEQVRGSACAWCSTPLTTASAVDLGERPLRRLDGAVTMFPRSCLPCSGTKAMSALQVHTAACEQCVDDVSCCGIGMALLRMMREARR
jgi:hypothetical protein